MSGTGFDQLSVIDRLMARLGGFIQGVGMSIPLARQIVERAIADDPFAAEHEIEEGARLDVDRAGMIDDTDPILEAVDAQRAAGIAVAPIGEELERWQIGDLVFSDAELLRRAESRGLVETP